MAKKLANYYFFSADISPLYSELSDLFYSKCDFAKLTSFAGPTPSREKLDEMIAKGLPIVQAAKMVSEFRINFLKEKQKLLAEYLYGRMTSEELQQIEELTFLPSRDSIGKMLDNGLALSKAISLIDRYNGDSQTPVLRQNQKNMLYELIYNRMHQKDFDSLKEFHFMPSISLMKDMIHNGLSYKKAVVLLNKLMHESQEEDHWIFGAKKEELLLSVIIPKAVSENFEPIDFQLDALPSNKMLELLKSYGQNVVDKAFVMLVQYVPKTSIERVEYLKLKSEFLEKYSASPKYVLAVLERKMKEITGQKIGISLTVEDGKTDPIHREAYLHLSDGRDIKFNFLGTEHYSSSRVLPQWMIEMVKKSDHFFYEGMSGLIMKRAHEACLLSSKISFDDVDLPIIKKIAKLYKNKVLKMEGDVLDSEIEQFISIHSMTMNGCRTSLNSAEHFVKNLFNESLSTNLELSETFKMIQEASSTSLLEIAKKVDNISKQIEPILRELNAAEYAGDKVLAEKIRKKLSDTESDLSELSQYTLVPLQYFDENGAIKLSALNYVLKQWEIFFDLEDIGVGLFPILDQKFADVKDAKETLAMVTSSEKSEYYLVPYRNKLWAEKIVEVIRETPEMLNPTILSGYFHIPGLIVELAHKGVQFSDEDLADAWRFVLDQQLPIGSIAYQALLRINENTPWIEHQLLLGDALDI